MLPALNGDEDALLFVLVVSTETAFAVGFFDKFVISFLDCEVPNENSTPIGDGDFLFRFELVDSESVVFHESAGDIYSLVNGHGNGEFDGSGDNFFVHVFHFDFGLCLVKSFRNLVGHEGENGQGLHVPVYHSRLCTYRFSGLFQRGPHLDPGQVLNLSPGTLWKSTSPPPSRWMLTPHLGHFGQSRWVSL